jgi:hypothetical protein
VAEEAIRRGSAPCARAIDVQLVEHDPLQVREQLHPVARVRQDSQVEHVGIGHQHVRRTAADQRAPCGRRIAVVDLAREVLGAETRSLRQGEDLAALILPQCLDRKEEERPARPACERLLEDRQLEDQRLSRSGGGGDEDVSPGPRGGDRLDLVRPETFDALRREGRGERRVGRRQEIHWTRRLGRQPPLGDESIAQALAQGAERLLERVRPGSRHGRLGQRGASGEGPPEPASILRSPRTRRGRGTSRSCAT